MISLKWVAAFFQGTGSPKKAAKARKEKTMTQQEIDPAWVDVTKTRRRIEEALRKAATTEKLIEIAKILGVEVAVTPRYCAHRPYFGPNQVRFPCQLREGLRYREADGPKDNGNGITFVVTKGPFYSDGKKKRGPWLEGRWAEWVEGWWAEVEKENSIGTYRYTISLRDRNIFPYRDGGWNSSNWIAFTDESRQLACVCCHH